MEVVPARAAVAGNPSDGYGGAVLAVPVRAVAARITARPADHLMVGRRPLASIVGSDGRDETDGLAALARAAVATYTEAFGPPPGCALGIHTAIPRSVGLAGSSAVVIAVLRALARIAGRPPLPPDELASLALAAEVDHLGIAAGLQDRLVQAHDAPLHMEFDGRGHRRVTPRHPLTILVAARPSATAPSGATHGPLRARWERGDGAVVAVMAELADAARAATDGLERGDLAAVAAAADRSFDLRRSILVLEPTHVELVETVRAAGAAANFSGSGGSVTVIAADAGAAERVRSALLPLGCVVYDVPVG